jgi:hypothetical protein
LDRLKNEAKLNKKSNQYYVTNSQLVITKDYNIHINLRLSTIILQPSILMAKEIGERIIHKMKEYVEVFVEGMVA